MPDDNASKPQRKASAIKKAAAKKQAAAPVAKKAVAKKAVAKKAVAKKAVAKKAAPVDPIIAALNEAMAAQASRTAQKGTSKESSRSKAPKTAKGEAASAKAPISMKRPGPLLVAVAALAISTISVGFALYQRTVSSSSSCVAATSSIRDFMKENPDKAVISETQRDSFLTMKNNVADKCSYSGARLVLETEVAAWLGAPTDLSQVTVVPPEDTAGSAPSTTTPTASLQPAGR
jgi:hypothetical protein